MRGLLRTLASISIGALVQTAHADTRADADAHARKGVAFYNLGKYEDAIAEFEEAYKDFQSDALLFNLAQAHRKLEHCDRALDYYHQFLAGEPAPELAEQVAKLLPDLEAACRTRDARPDSTAALPQRQQTASAQPPDASEHDDADSKSAAAPVAQPTSHLGATALAGELFSHGAAPITGASVTAMMRPEWFPYAELGGVASVAGLWRYTSDAVVAQLAGAIEYRADFDWGRLTAAGALGVEYVSAVGASRDVVPGTGMGGAWAPLVRAELGIEHDVSHFLALRAGAVVAGAPRVGSLEAPITELDVVLGVRYAP
ncbi:MAG TPA: tetratricopeptide repeat protein [Kofleriaceae bacterium]|jgi:tetratricopeptide (TPR) repeat protein|nr:tetratricopeptide repeat protein [Kofleriaceae bacterium]